MKEVNCLTTGCNQKHGHEGPHAYVKPSIGEWSAQEVRNTQDAHRFCGLSEDALRTLYAVNIPAAVTLEGLAAVIGSLSEALNVLGGDRNENKETIAALVKAAEAVTALLTTEVKTPAADEWTEKRRETRRAIAADFAASERAARAEERKVAVQQHIEDHLRADWTEAHAKRHAEHVAVDVALREASGQAEANRKARAEQVEPERGEPKLADRLACVLYPGNTADIPSADAMLKKVQRLMDVVNPPRGEAERLRDVTQGATIRVYPKGDGVTVVDCTPRRTGRSADVSVRDASEAHRMGLLEALLDRLCGRDGALDGADLGALDVAFKAQAEQAVARAKAQSESQTEQHKALYNMAIKDALSATCFAMSEAKTHPEQDAIQRARRGISTLIKGPKDTVEVPK